MLSVIFARLQFGVNEGCFGERLGQEQIANAGRFLCYRFPEFLVEHLVAEFANNRVWQRAGFLGFQSDLNEVGAMRDEDVKKAAIFVGSLLYGIGPIESGIKSYNPGAVW